jgi:hypothetical protein
MMNPLRKIRTLLLVGLVAVGVLALGERLSVPGFHGIVSITKADVGRPLSPVSVAGVARRSSRN